MIDRSYECMGGDNPFLARPPDPVLCHREQGLAAVRIAHADQLDEIAAALNQGQSVLVLCDKALSEYLHGALDKHSGLPTAEWKWVTYSGSPTSTVMPHLTQSMAERLRDAITAPNSPNCIAVARHLDLMMYTVDDRPRQEVNDILYWLAEFPSAVKLFFWDPIFTLPAVVQAAFPNKVTIRALDRELLWKLMTPDEARKFSPSGGSFTVAAQSALYQHVSGTSVVELRRIMRSIVNSEPPLPDMAGRASQSPTEALLHVRKQTGITPQVPLAHVSGYAKLADRLKREVVFPIQLRLRATNEEELRRADSLAQRGIILYGPPGTGKTEWAKRLAHELGTPLFVIHGPELKSRYVGETEAAIRRVIQQARRNAPSAILIDEMDALMASRRDSSSSFENSVVNTLLTEMDGMRTEETVIFIGTTNRPEALDEGFLRPGRFGLRVLVGYPDDIDRTAILEQYNVHFMLGLTQDSITDLVTLTRPRGEEKFSGDHLRAICQYLSRESLYRRENKGAGVTEPSDRAFQNEAVEKVRETLPRRAAAAPRW